MSTAVDSRFLEGHDLAVYSTDWCPDCRRLERYLDSLGVPYRKVSIDDDQQAGEKLESETGKRGVPYVLVDGRSWVRGYHREHPGRFSPALLWQDLRAAVGA